MSIATIAGIVSIGGGLYSLASQGGKNSSGGTTGGNPATYVPQGQGQTDTYLQDLIKQIYTGGGAAAGNLANNPYAGQALGAANAASGYGPGFANNNFQGAQGLTDLLYGSVLPGQQQGASSLQSYINQIVPQQLQGIGAVQQGGQQTGQAQYGLGGQLAGQTSMLGGAGLPGIGGLQSGAQSLLNTGFDPQNALHDRTQTQVMDGLQAANAAAGIGSSPYGAGLVGQGLNNFNIDWQNQQLQRQQAALSGAGSAYGQAGNLGTQALGNYNSGYTGAGNLFGQGNSSLAGGYTNAANLGTAGANTAGSGYTGASNILSSTLGNFGNAYTNQAGLQGTGLQTLVGAGGLPYGTYGGQQTDALSGYGSLNGLSSILSNYLGIGQNATGQGINGQTLQNGQSALAGQGIGQGLQGLSSLFSNVGSGGYGNFAKYDAGIPMQNIPNYQQ